MRPSDWDAAQVPNQAGGPKLSAGCGAVLPPPPKDGAASFYPLKAPVIRRLAAYTAAPVDAPAGSGYHRAMSHASAAPPTDVLDVDRLGCQRGGRLVFDALSFRLEAGRALLLTGPNGAGKSSLLRLLAGLGAPAAGRVLWNRADIRGDRAAHAARSRYLGHANALKPVLTTAECVTFAACLHGGDATGTAAALAQVGLERRGADPVQFLSAGQRRRLALACLMAVPAPLWLLDEPTVGLDTASIAAFEAALGAHLDKGGLAVLATHLDIASGGRSASLRIDHFHPADPLAGSPWAAATA